MTVTLSPEARALAITGAALFLAGLVQGAAVGLFLNPRMALSAHLAAVQSGMAMMIAAAFWSHAGLNGLGERVARWTLAVGLVGLWLGLTLAAATGASCVLPMAGAGYSATPLVERMVAVLVLGSSAAMTVGWAMFALGLLRKR